MFAGNFTKNRFQEAICGDWNSLSGLRFLEILKGKDLVVIGTGGIWGNKELRHRVKDPVAEIKQKSLFLELR